MSQPPASGGPKASSPRPLHASNEGELPAAVRMDAAVPERIEPSTIPFAKVKARPELVGHTEDGEPLLKLAQGDRKAATRRDIDRRAIEAALANAKRSAPPRNDAEASVAEVPPLAPQKQPAWPWLAGALVPVAVVGSVVALRHLPRPDAPASPTNGALTDATSPAAPNAHDPVEELPAADVPSPAAASSSSDEASLGAVPDAPIPQVQETGDPEESRKLPRLPTERLRSGPSGVTTNADARSQANAPTRPTAAPTAARGPSERESKANPAPTANLSTSPILIHVKK